MSNILELRGVCKSFGSFSLRDVSFALPEGFVMGFIGPNGAGKTTTVKLILNMLSPEAGQINVFGKDNSAGEREMKERVGVVMDQPFYVNEWRLTDVERALMPFYSGWSAETYRKLLKDFDLDPKKKVKELSRGMTMKLMIAAALSHNADLLILDEPTSGLDAVARNELLNILSDFIAGGNKGVLFSTHITADLEKIADYITFINDGRILYSGAKDDLLNRYRVVKGAAGDLSLAQRERVLGYRAHSAQAGFDGLVEASFLADMPAGLVSEPASLDEIMLRFNWEGRANE